MDEESNLNDEGESCSSTSDGCLPPSKKAKNVTGKEPVQLFLTSLPADVLLTIFSYLGYKSICNCAVLCSTLYNITKHGSIYKKVCLRYNMNSHFLESLINKISCPRDVSIEYKWYDRWYDDGTDADDTTEFDKHVGIFLRKCGKYITTLKIESCRSEEVLLNISECVNLKSLHIFRSEGSFKTLPSLNTLTDISLFLCKIPQEALTEFIKNNHNLKELSLSDNVKIDENKICENMPTYNTKLEVLHLCERKKSNAKSVRCLAKLAELKDLELTSGKYGFKCDPEDSLEELAASCTKLQSIAIVGWKEVNDHNFIPALHRFTKLKKLDMRGTNITIKSCQEAAVTLPLLKSIDIFKCSKIKKAEVTQFQKQFKTIGISK